MASYKDLLLGKSNSQSARYNNKKEFEFTNRDGSKSKAQAEVTEKALRKRVMKNSLEAHANGRTAANGAGAATLRD